MTVEYCIIIYRSRRNTGISHFCKCDTFTTCSEDTDACKDAEVVIVTFLSKFLIYSRGEAVVSAKLTLATNFEVTGGGRLSRRIAKFKFFFPEGENEEEIKWEDLFLSQIVALKKSIQRQENMNKRKREYEYENKEVRKLKEFLRMHGSCTIRWFCSLGPFIRLARIKPQKLPSIIYITPLSSGAWGCLSLPDKNHISANLYLDSTSSWEIIYRKWWTVRKHF